jgi:hypothetical protein
MENGNMLKIEAGKFYRTRNGRKVGPMEAFETTDGYNWRSRGDVKGFWSDAGQRQNIALRETTDLIAEWSDAPDLTAITTPFGLLDAETQDALRKHGGPYEAFVQNECGFEWRRQGYDGVTMETHRALAWRVKPTPPAPKVETVTLHGERYQWGQAIKACAEDTHRITFDLIDGEPDCSTIRMVKL